MTSGDVVRALKEYYKKYKIEVWSQISKARLNVRLGSLRASLLEEPGPTGAAAAEWLIGYHDLIQIAGEKTRCTSHLGLTRIVQHRRILSGLLIIMT